MPLQIEERGYARERRQQGADREARHRLPQHSNRRESVAALQARQGAQQTCFIRRQVGAIDLLEPQYAEPQYALSAQQCKRALEGA